MTECVTVRHYLESFALDERACPESDLVDDHLQDCEICRAEVRILRDAWAELPANLTPIQPSPKMEADLMSRLNHPQSNRLRQRITLKDQQAHPLVRYRWLRFPVAATIVVGLANLLYFNSPLGQQNAERRELDQQLQNIAQALEKTELIKQDFGTPQLHSVALQDLHSRTQAQGYLVYDLVAKEAHFLGEGIHLPNEVSICKLWLLDENRSVISSSIVRTNSQGYGTAIIPLPTSLGVPATVILTREKDPTVIKPSSVIELESQLVIPES